MLAYQQRQQKRRNRVITPKMLKARPIEFKQNVVMRSQHKVGSTGSVTSDVSNRSDMTEKMTNMRTRMRRKPEIERLDTLESVETFESLKNDAEKKMEMANALLAEATEAKRQAELEIAEEKERLKAAEEEHKSARKNEEELRQLVEEQAAEERKRYEAIKEKLAAEAEEKRKAHEEAEERIRIMEAEQKRLDQEHKAALEEARNQAKIATEEERRKAQLEAEVRTKVFEQEQVRLDAEYTAALEEAERQAKIAAEEEKRRQEVEEQRLKLEDQFKKSALNEKEQRAKIESNIQEVVEEKIRLMEVEQKRLDQEYKAALEEAQRQKMTAADEEKRRVEVEQQRLRLEDQLRAEVARHEEITAATKKRFFKISLQEADAKRKAQAEATERICILEAAQKQLDQDHKAALEEGKRLAKIVADEEKRRVEVEEQRLHLQEKLQMEIERHAMIVSSEQLKFFKSDEAKRKLEEEAQKQAQIAAIEGKKRLEAEAKRLQLEEEAQKQAQIAAEEGKKRLEAEQMRIDLENRIIAENEKRAAQEESLKWFDIRRLQVGRQAAAAAKLKSPSHKQVKKETETQSCSGFFISEGVSDCTSEDGSDIIRSNSTLKEAVEVEMPTDQATNNLSRIQDSWTKPGDQKRTGLIGSTSFDVGRLTVTHEVRRETPSICSTPVLPSSAQRKTEKPSSKLTELKSILYKNENGEQKSTGDAKKSVEFVSETIRELAAEQGCNLSTEESEELKMLDEACLKVEDRVENARSKIREASLQLENEKVEADKKLKKSRRKKKEEGNDARVKQLELGVKQLESELAELCKLMTAKKEQADLLLKESISDRSQKSDSSYNLAIQRGAGKASEEKDLPENFATIHEYEEFKENVLAAGMVDDHYEEGIEVMPTLSTAEQISVNTPVSIDESAFEQKSNQPQRTALMNKKNPLNKTPKEEKRMFQSATVMAKPDHQYQETFVFEHEDGGVNGVIFAEASQDSQVLVNGGNANTIYYDDENVAYTENGAQFIDPNDPMYDDEVALLVANSNDALAYEEDEVNEIDVPNQSHTAPPERFIHVPARRPPSVLRVRSKEIAVQTDNHRMTSPGMMSPRLKTKSPRVTLPSKRESFLERATFFGTTACTGGRQTVFSCGDPKLNDTFDTSKDHSSLANEINYYDPKSPAAQTRSRGGRAYSQDEEDLVTRAVVNALNRVDNAREEFNGDLDYPQSRQRRKHSKRTKRRDDIMSVDGRYVNTRDYVRERREREQVPRNLELQPRVQTPRRRQQTEYRDEEEDDETSTSSQEERKQVPRNLELKPRVQTPRRREQTEYRDEEEDDETSTSSREERKENIRKRTPKEKKGLGKKMIKGIKRLAKARIVYDD